MFVEAIANTQEEFLQLANDSLVIFYEVYTGSPCYELESLFCDQNAGELFLRFDLSKHLPDARSRFLELSNLTRRAYNFPESATEKPIPYFASYVKPFGHYAIAWRSDEILELISKTRKEATIASRFFEMLEKK